MNATATTTQAAMQPQTLVVWVSTDTSTVTESRVPTTTHATTFINGAQSATYTATTLWQVWH